MGSLCARKLSTKTDLRGTCYERTKSEPGIAKAWPANVVERRGEFGWRRVAAVHGRRGIQKYSQWLLDDCLRGKRPWPSRNHGGQSQRLRSQRHFHFQRNALRRAGRRRSALPASGQTQALGWCAQFYAIRSG